ncbi:ER membrane protein complex subunit 6 isoform X2 [Dermochelys coriacea]|uniref:ER membrane protein complex subunit 6 isoform X2 n=1 Tax=Dermochelys coriacea TaxID=27794 RepID=UPI001CA7D242|nr:ER membrane protein complex subunit 6 isoform X2 [Dermochelys coriacea]
MYDMAPPDSPARPPPRQQKVPPAPPPAPQPRSQSGAASGRGSAGACASRAGGGGARRFPAARVPRWRAAAAGSRGGELQLGSKLLDKPFRFCVLVIVHLRAGQRGHSLAQEGLGTAGMNGYEQCSDD